MKNYSSIILLPIFSKIFERVIYKSLFNCFPSNKLFNGSKSSFITGDSRIAQLLSIFHEIPTVCDSSTFNVRGVLLNILKAFHKVQQVGLLFKLKPYGKGELLSPLKNYLKNPKQSVVLVNGQNLHWKEILSGVLQGPVFGPLLFLIYINNLPDDQTSICKIFADVTSLFLKSSCYEISNTKMNWVLTYRKLANGHSNGKCILTLIPSNKGMRYIFSKIKHIVISSILTFNYNDLTKCSHQKHLRILLN